jgi:hypothetical protein
MIGADTQVIESIPGMAPGGVVAVGTYAKAADEGVAVGGGATVTGYRGIALGEEATAGEKEFGIGFSIETVNFSKATVQAKDYLDADGNSIIGAGGGGDPEWAEVSIDEGSTALTVSSSSTAVGPSAAVQRSGVAVGKDAKSLDMGCVAIGDTVESDGNWSVAIGSNIKAKASNSIAIGATIDTLDECPGSISMGFRTRINSDSSHAIAIGTEAEVASNSEYAIALGYQADSYGSVFSISPYIEDVDFTRAKIKAKDYLDINGKRATVSPALIAEAFTTLQAAVADEETVEGIKTALTNALGGLIEKFEGIHNA